VVALVVLLIGVAHPPRAFVEIGTARVPLAITSWCWDAHCGAPLTRSARRVNVARGAAVRVELGADPLEATVTVGGAAAKVALRGREVSWVASRGGGVSAFVKYRRGWVVYPARLAVH
jgi:hypothetical protein